MSYESDEIMRGGNAGGGKTASQRERVERYAEEQGRVAERIEWTPTPPWGGRVFDGGLRSDDPLQIPYDDETVLNPRQRESLGGPWPGVPGYGARGGFVVGWDMAREGSDQTCVVLVRGGRRPEPTVRQLWRAVRWRNLVGRKFVLEWRDWWVGMYGPSYDRAEGVTRLYFGLGLPWVLRLTFEGDGS